MSRMPPVQVQGDWTTFTGGLDTSTPAMQKKPGTVIASQNFEQNLNGGYDTIAGYERFDGHAAPSDADYALLVCDLTGDVNDGDIVSNLAGTAYGTVIDIIYD